MSSDLRLPPALLARLAMRRVGVVADFDDDAGLGEIEIDDPSFGTARIGFHCVAIADGSRHIEVGARVGFAVSMTPRGEVEARAITPC